MVDVLTLVLWFLTSPIKVNANPRIAFAPTTVTITVEVEPKETNRGMHLIINSANYYRSSVDADFVGEESPRIRKYQYELRYPGHYEIIAILKRVPPDKDERATIEVCLSGPDVEC